MASPRRFGGTGGVSFAALGSPRSQKRRAALRGLLHVTYDPAKAAADNSKPAHESAFAAAERGKVRPNGG